VYCHHGYHIPLISICLFSFASLLIIWHFILVFFFIIFISAYSATFFFSCFLKVLKLQACKYLTETSLEPLYKGGALPALQELDLSYGTFSQSAIDELLACCTNLTHVSLNGCLNMHDLNWGCSCGQSKNLPAANTLSRASSTENVPESSEQSPRLLQNLNCVGCPNIRKVVIPFRANCCHLLILNLSLSANLKEVDVTCLNLCFLNLRYGWVCNKCVLVSIHLISDIW